MIIITKKLHPRRLVAGCALFALALGVLGAGLGLVRDIQSAAAVADLQVDPRGIKTNADRVAFLEGYGWIVSQEPAAVEDIRLPDTFDASYDEDLSLSEIAENYGISRQGVRDVIVRAEAYMTEIEDKTGLVKRFMQRTPHLERIEAAADELRRLNDRRYEDSRIAELVTVIEQETAALKE